MKKDLVSLKELTRHELAAFFRVADGLKHTEEKPLSRKSLALIFQNPSMRTRVSFEVGMFQLGGQTIYLGPEDIQLGVRETVSDIAQVLSRYVDGIVARTFSHKDVEMLARYATVPVINGLSDLEHPCQALADLYTIQKWCGRLEAVRIAYIGDGNNVLHSLLQGASCVGAHLSVATPKGYEPDEAIVKQAKEIAKKSGSQIMLCHDPQKAATEADIVYTDVWTSMGQEKERKKRLKVFRRFQVNERLMTFARPSAKFMHCLPAHRGEEVAKKVFEGKQSIVLDQAENRLHIQKAILVELLGKA